MILLDSLRKLLVPSCRLRLAWDRRVDLDNFVPDEDTVVFLDGLFPERALRHNENLTEYQWYAAKRELVRDLKHLYEERIAKD